MDAEQMDLLERLARLRDLGAISRREFAREKEAILRALPRSVPVPLRALPAPGGGAVSVAPASAVPARLARVEPEAGGLARVGRIAGWLLWMAFSVGGLDALIRRDALLALALLVSGLLFAPPLHRLLATRMGIATRLTLTAAGVLAALGMAGSAPGRPNATARTASPEAAACGDFVSETVGERGAVARDGIVRPWRKVWTDLLWARVAGASLYAEWRATGD
jgi:hypothetical protein